jgi:hypothetical protein
MEFMVQYKDAYGVLHNEAILAEDIDAAWALAEKLLGSENRIQFICKAP